MPNEPSAPDLVELVRGLLEAANLRDFDEVLSFYAPDAVWEAVSLGTRFEGVPAIRGFLEDWLGSYEKSLSPEIVLAEPFRSDWPCEIHGSWQNYRSCGQAWRETPGAALSVPTPTLRLALAVPGNPPRTPPGRPPRRKP
jgi:hypothetical protein